MAGDPFVGPVTDDLEGGGEAAGADVFRPRVDDGDFAVHCRGERGEGSRKVGRSDQQQQWPTCQLLGERGPVVGQLAGDRGGRPEIRAASTRPAR